MLLLLWEKWSLYFMQPNEAVENPHALCYNAEHGQEVCYGTFSIC